MNKIKLIDEPVSEEMIRAELEAVLGGWTCGTYDTNYCSNWSSGKCSATAVDYCIEFSLPKKS